MEIINHYSILWSGILILGAAAFFLLRKDFSITNGIKVAGIAVLLLVGWLVIRPQQATTDELSQFKAEIGQGKSVLLELQSPY